MIDTILGIGDTVVMHSLCPHEAYIFFNFFFLAVPHGMLDLSSRPGIEPAPRAVEARSPNHWTAREFPKLIF